MKYKTHLTMACTPDWLERLHLMAGGKRKRAGYVRDVIDILYTDKWLRDLIYQKRQVINERSK